MTALREPAPLRSSERAIEVGFPIVQLSRLAEKESWRKELGRPLYHIHKWWATRLGSVFRAINIAALSESRSDVWSKFYEFHNLSDKVVLDPFMGSGTTLGEALKLGCSVVGSDINPISTFLVRQALTPVSEDRLRRAFSILEKDVSEDIRKYYTTKDRETGETIQVLYGFWVKTVELPTGEVTPLFSSYVFAKNAYAKRNPSAQIVCPGCWSVFGARYDAESAVCTCCGKEFNPQKGPANGQSVTGSDGVQYKIKSVLPSDGSPPRERLYALLALRADGKKVYLAPTPHDHALYNDAVARLAVESLPLPTREVRPGHNTNQARGYNYTKWSDFFNDRQKLCLGILLRGILKLEDVEAREQLLCLFSSTLEFNNRFCSYKGEGTGAVRHMFSHHILKPERTPLENSVWGGKRTSGTFASLFESRLLPAKKYLNYPFELELEPNSSTGKRVASNPMRPALEEYLLPARSGQTAVILNGDSANLPLDDCSVDAVITDPPYFDFIHYSELSDFFYAWLAPVLYDKYPYFKKANSSDSREVQHKDAGTFSALLGNVLRESARVLKDDGVLVFSFHHSRAEGWVAIYEALCSANLTVVASHPIHAELRGSSPKSGTHEPISLDAILVCRKRSTVSQANYSESAIMEVTKRKARELRDGGLSISRTDEFVIASGEILGTANFLSADELKQRFSIAREMLFANGASC